MEKVMESRGTRSIRYRETKRERRLARGERRRGQTWEERGGGGGRGEEPTAEEGRQHEAAPALLEICEMGEHKGQTKEVRPRKFRSPVAVHGKSQKNPPAAEGDLYQLTFPRPRQSTPPPPPRRNPVTNPSRQTITPCRRRRGRHDVFQKERGTFPSLQLRAGDRNKRLLSLPLALSSGLFQR